MMFFQNDKRWAGLSLNKSSETIGSVGCLLTALCNIAIERDPDIEINPELLNIRLIENNGYTKGNLIIWSVVEDLLDVHIDHIYTGDIDYDIDTYYIVNFLNPTTGHFTNLLSKHGDKYNIYDVWDDTKKTISKPRRIVKLHYGRD